MSNKILYRRVGDYNIPNLILPPEEASVTLGKWGLLRKDYLLKNKKILFIALIAQGKLYQHFAEIEKQARDTFDTLDEQMKQIEGVTEQLKEENQTEWVQRMNSIQERAKEIVIHNIIFN